MVGVDQGQVIAPLRVAALHTKRKYDCSRRSSEGQVHEVHVCIAVWLLLAHLVKHDTAKRYMTSSLDFFKLQIPKELRGFISGRIFQ
jgi:hypothetical protein